MPVCSFPHPMPRDEVIAVLREGMPLAVFASSRSPEQQASIMRWHEAQRLAVKYLENDL